jgi:hypothetical protein
MDESAKIALEERLREQDEQHPGYAAAWREFRTIVLKNGGDHVVPPADPDLMIGMLGKQGALVPSATVIVERAGAPGRCHENAVALWRSGDASAIGTGYSLGPDSLWREHSWAWTPDDCLIETNETRFAYFGLRMEADLAEWFADWIAPSGDRHQATP